MANVKEAMESCKPYVIMTFSELLLAIYMALLQAVLDPSRGIDAIVFFVYESTISAVVLSSLAFLVERGRRPKFSFTVVLWALLIGCLDVPLGQLLMTASMRYVTAKFQSVALNTTPAVVFVMAVVCRRESFRFLSVNGQAKLWGVLISATGALLMVIVSSKESSSSAESNGPLSATGFWILGSLMNGIAVLATASGTLLVEKVSMTYPATVTLAAMINFFGTVLTVIAAVLIERKPSSWKITWSPNLQLFTIFYGGIVVTGGTFWAHIWCIHKKGPVFTMAFSPLLIVFSFILEAIITGSIFHLRSNLSGALLVVGGLYLLLWSKCKDKKKVSSITRKQGALQDKSSVEPLLPN
ncbi:putative EamA domain-containing protein [Dioscorea sansibarensis]